MSLLLNVLSAWKAKSTHHKLALDALTRLTGPHAGRWRDLFCKEVEAYLEGAKAPDTEFRDFKNHVLHVEQDNWGGAAKTAAKWYPKLVQLLKERSWGDAAYAAGVLSHYYTDPLMPFHTGQSEEETQIHRAAEWSMTKSYDVFKQILEGGDDYDPIGYPDVATHDGEADWIVRMTIDGATQSHRHYDAIIERYDFARGRKNPPDGLDDDLRHRVAECIGHAIVGLGHILDRAFTESGQTPPRVETSLTGTLSKLSVPIFWVTKKMADAGERRQVERIYKELTTKGRVDKTMPDDDRAVREAHAREVLKVSVEELEDTPLGPIGHLHGQAREQGTVNREQAPLAATARERVAPPTPTPTATPAPDLADTPIFTDFFKPKDSEPATDPPVAALPPSSAPDGAPSPRAEKDVIPLSPAGREGRREGVADRSLRFHLATTDDVVDAPSIGPKTARRLDAAGIRTVADLLEANPTGAAARIESRYITAEVLRDWQAQARLVCRVPNLRGHDAQILVAVGVTDPEDLAELTVEDVLDLVGPFCDSAEGERILRGGSPPDAAEAGDWIAWACAARPLERAA
ncbi:MAG: DUF4332 domain-containing protein [Planctomycetota bacterium]